MGTQESVSGKPAPPRTWRSILGRRLATRRARVGLVCGLLLPGLTYAGVELTSVPRFCRSCHEIRAPHDSWAASPHGTVKGKTRATCRDCHVPSWKQPWAVLWFKISHGAKDSYHHFAGNARPGDPLFYFGLKEKTVKDVSDKMCLSCHADIRSAAKDVISTPESGVIRGLHSSEEARKLRCTVCHKNTGHDVYD